MARPKIVGVIPARYGSTRFEGKPLKHILGRPLLQWVIDGARRSKKISKLIVATDDARISKLAEELGVEATMTDTNLPSGTDRVWAAARDLDFEFIINIQGDEPLLTGGELDALATAFEEDSTLEMATLGRPFKTKEELESPQTAKIVVNHQSEALYFSRFPIPYSRVHVSAASDFSACLKHIGFYGYTKSFLGRLCAEKPSQIERAESLEQLRALWLGAKIKVVMTDYDSWGVDTPEDVIRVEKLLRQRSHA